MLEVKRLPLPGSAALDVVVRAGETVGVIASGAQLDAVARAVTGMDAADTGSVAVLGRPFSVMRGEDRLAIRSAAIGVAAEQWPLLGWLSVEENVGVALPPNCIDQDLDEALRAFDVEPFRRLMPSDLPPADRERVRLARAAGKRPAILVWQPGAALSSAEGAELVGALRSFLGPNAGLLILLEPGMRTIAVDRALDVSAATTTRKGSRRTERRTAASTPDTIEVPLEYRKNQPRTGKH